MPVKCPACGETQNRTELRRSGNHSFGLYVLGGFIGGLFWALGQEKKYECGKCSQIFFSHTRVSRVFSVLLFIVYAVVVIGLAYFIWMAIASPSEIT
jgi:hypothetical protein